MDETLDMQGMTRDGHALLVLTIVLLVTTWVVLVLRLGVRGFILRSLGWDDATLFLSGLVFTALAAGTIKTCDLVIPEPLQPRVVLELINALFTGLTLYIVATAIFKISLGFFFLRFLVSTWHRRLVCISVALFTLYSVAFFTAIYVSFGSTAALSEKMANKACDGLSCSSWHIVGPMTYIGGVFNSLIDIVFAILPILFIRGTNIPHRSKISICMLLGLGSISGIASIVRLAYVSGLNLNHSLLPSTGYVTSTLVELATALMTLSCAALRPLFTKRARGQRDMESDNSERGMIVAEEKKEAGIAEAHERLSMSITSETSRSGKGSKSIVVTREVELDEVDAK